MTQHRRPEEQPAMLLGRLSAQRLAGTPGTTPEEVVGRLLAVQAQDPRGFRLSVRARSSGLSSADVEDALTERRSLLVTWLNRGTLHLIRAEDYWWLHPLTAERLPTSVNRRLRQTGVSPTEAERGVQVVVEQIAEHGPRTRDEIRRALHGAGVPTAGQAIVHLLVAASLQADVIRGPVRGGEQCFVTARAWLPAPSVDPADRPAALARLAHRYLVGHGPADAADLATWAGIGLRDARTGLAGLGERMARREDGLLDLVDRDPAAPLPKPRLLGPFDPLLHGWASREFVLGGHLDVVTTNGLFRPFALVDGRAVATWGLSGGRLTIRPLEPIPPGHRQELEQDALDVQRFLGLPATPPVLESG